MHEVFLKQRKNGEGTNHEAKEDLDAPSGKWTALLEILPLALTAQRIVCF
ncbi:hypothetical protein A2U01_0080184, partial [Trifolium medium]|nr:hypothetical protein [Trifolium medium]